MKTLPVKALICLTCVMVLLPLLSGQPKSAQADVGVHPILPGGSNIEPGTETPVQMAAETVIMTVRQATEADNALITLNPDAYGLQFQPIWFSAVAEVSASFTMRNPTSQEISLTAWFPLASALEKNAWDLNPGETVPRIESFQVVSGSSAIAYTVSDLPNPQGADKPALPWASFPLTFPANQDTIVQVSYLVPLVPSVKGNALGLYYVFQTGASWAGSIGQAELILNLPYPASDETLAQIPPGTLELPYMVARTSAGLPAGVLLDGNQATWRWTNFEPGPQDDFSVWLLRPSEWETLEAARRSVQDHPEDGRVWMQLGLVYRDLATMDYDLPTAFNRVYLPLGVEAFQKAASLLPDHPAPHAGIALLVLAPFMPDQFIVLDPYLVIKDELRQCKELEASHPDLVGEFNLTCSLAEDALSINDLNFATVTPVVDIPSTQQAQQTMEALITPIWTSSPTVISPPSPTPVPSNTALPLASATPLPAQQATSGQNLFLLVGASIILVVIVGYFVLKLRR